jgi:hypothetical protein
MKLFIAFQTSALLCAVSSAVLLSGYIPDTTNSFRLFYGILAGFFALKMEGHAIAEKIIHKL